MSVAVVGIGLGLVLAGQVLAQEAPEWVAHIRPDHPRLFLNEDSWPAVRAMSEGPLAEHYAKVRARVDAIPAEPEVRDWGDESALAAYCWRMTGGARYLDLTRALLDRTVEFCHAQIAARKAVNWYSRSRIAALAAFDWIFDDVPADWREQWGRSMLDHIADVQPGGVPNIERVNRSGPTTGFYGTPSLLWFAGLAMLDAGIDDARALEYLVRGRELNLQLLEHRRAASGDDGGAASPTLGYAFGAYPWAEFGFLHTWESATGERLADEWPYLALLGNYVMWNYLPGIREFGYGDAPHTDNVTTRWEMHMHMAQIMHFYGETQPDWAALSRYVQTLYPEFWPDRYWGFTPPLLTRMELAPPALDPGRLPHARHFEAMGQVFMRSGSGEDDTYASFTAGGILSQHRHYDNLNFCIFRKGFLAIDSGTRVGNAEQLQNYYAQTVAHNCVLIDMPGEAVSPYWNGTVHVQEGGQYKQIGSRVVAFETNDQYSYVGGDATEAYRPEKCELCLRQFVFVYPEHFVVFDRVRSTRPEFTKRWLLHTAREPRIDGPTIVADQEEGRIFCRTLLPENALLTPVGGPGREFLAGGRNWPLPAGVEYSELMGWGRVEVSAPQPAQEALFLHLLQAADQREKTMSAAELVREEGLVGVRFAAGERTAEVTFATAGEAAGRIRIARGQQVLVERDLTQQVQAQTGLATPDAQ
ncbi:MAG: heparinase II/III family protein [Armatimonadota bacterium]